MFAKRQQAQVAQYVDDKQVFGYGRHHIHSADVCITLFMLRSYAFLCTNQGVFRVYSAIFC
jgi:hypothetical protein